MSRRDDPDAPSDPPAYRALVAMKPADKSLTSWAKRAGLAPNYFVGLRRHGNPHPEALRKLLTDAGISHLSYAMSLERVGSEVMAVSGSTRDFVREHGAPPLKPLPVWGTATGGDFGDIDEEIELTELFLDQALGSVPRPAYLAGDDGAYALTIVGDSMIPRFKPREQVEVSPRAPLSIGDDVIVQLRGRDGDEERIKMVLIKELVRRSSTFVELRQFNPDRVFRVELRRVAAMHKVTATRH